jgi:glycosyltransferase involved in cell wall biosynthesis
MTEHDETGGMLTIVTTCKGRLANLKQSLPMMVRTGLPVVVVDYDCPDGTRRYVAENFPQIRIVAIDNEPLFSVSRARNLGAATVATRFIGFFDADALLKDGFASEFGTAALSDSVFCVAGEGDLHGQCIVPKNAFERVGGYDEAMTGWAGEDGDFYLRLQAAGFRRTTMRPGLVVALPHGDDERIRYTGGTPRVDSHRLNATYGAMKRDIEALQAGRALTHDERLALRDKVAAALRRAAATGKAQTVDYRIWPNIGAAGYLYDGTTGYRLNGALRYEIEPLRRGIGAKLLSALRRHRRPE